ncbi:MAG: SdpI family protein [Eubacteriales bacterium]|jgi:uncharacterized membrane protein
MSLYLSLMVLLTPAILVAIGWLWCNRPPQTISLNYGYRTRRSMQSHKAWHFAHRYFGRLWMTIGLILIPLSLGVLYLLRAHAEKAAIGIVIVQCVCMLFPILPTELALQKEFGDGKSNSKKSRKKQS